MAPTRWAVVGPGRIAHAFAKALHSLPDARLVAVCGRDATRAQAFAQQWAHPREAVPAVLTDLQALLDLPQLDALYVATPHAQHHSAVMLALQAGKAVLCEKPLVTSRTQGQALVDLARQRRVFLMEALWTRFLPLYATVGQWLQKQAIGELRAIQSSFCFNAPYDPQGRLFNPALAGGALLDLGVYNLSLTQWVLAQGQAQAQGQGQGQAQGHCAADPTIHAQARLAATGVDQHLAATLHFGGAAPVLAQFVCALDMHADNALRVFGAQGHIVVPQHFSRATRAELHRVGEPMQTVDAPFAVNGFEGEIAEVQRCLRAGLIESPHMSHDHSLAVLGWMDQIRAQIGVAYPWE